MPGHLPRIGRLSYAQLIEVIRRAGYSAAQCPVCGLVCSAQEGQDPLLEGLAAPTLETNRDSPRYGQMLGQADHAGCPDRLLGL